MASTTAVERGQVWKDLDKRNTGERLVQVLGFVVTLLPFGGRVRYAVCITLTTGGRPCHSTSFPERIGTGLVGQLVKIRIDRMLTGRFYRRAENLAA
jgi:hypothetical protein